MGIDYVTCNGDALMMRFSIAADIDLVRVLTAVKQHPELTVQGGNPPTLVYTRRRAAPEELLGNAVKVMRGVVADFDALAPAGEATEESHES